MCIIYSLYSRSISKRFRNYKLHLRNTIVAVVLVVTFGLAWVIGFLATTGLPEAVRLGGLIIFTTLVSFHGVLFFLLHTLRSRKLRKQCKNLYYNATCKKTTPKRSKNIGVYISKLQDSPHHSSSVSGNDIQLLSIQTSSSSVSAITESSPVRQQLPSLTEVSQHHSTAAIEREQVESGMVVSNMAYDAEEEIEQIGPARRVEDRHDSTPGLSSTWEEEEEGKVVHSVSINF